MKFCLKRAAFAAVCLTFFSTGSGLCAEGGGAGATAIAVSFKALAKALVGQDGIRRLSQRIEAMDDAEFSARYREVYAMLSEVQGLQKSYGLREKMSRAEMLAVLKTWNGRKVCSLIDAVPDARINAKFNEYLSYARERDSGTDTLKQIQALWGRVLSELRGK